jgi:hypothetical protein
MAVIWGIREQTPVTKSAFQSAAKKWLLGLLGVVLSLPVFTVVAMIPGVCVDPQGWCFFVSILLMFWVAPVAAVAFSLLLLWTIGRRVRGLGMRPTWTAAVFIWFLTGVPTFAFGAISLIGFAVGQRVDFLVHSLIAPPVTMVMFLLTFVVFLWRAEPEDVHPDEAERRTALSIAAVAAAHVTIINAGPALGNLALIPFLPFGELLRPFINVLRWGAAAASLGLPGKFLPLIYWIDFAIFSSALAYVITFARDRRPPPGRSAVAQRASVPPRASFGRR